MRHKHTQHHKYAWTESNRIDHRQENKMLCPRLLKSLACSMKVSLHQQPNSPLEEYLAFQCISIRLDRKNRSFCRQTVRGLENAASNRPSKLFDLQQEVASFRPCRLTGPFSLADRQVPLGFGPNENHVLSGPLQCLVVHTKHIPWPLRALSKGAIWRSKDFWLHELLWICIVYICLLLMSSHVQICQHSPWPYRGPTKNWVKPSLQNFLLSGLKAQTRMVAATIPFCRVCSIPSYYCSIPFLWILVNAIGIWQQGLATQSNFFSPHVLFCSSLMGMHSFAAHIAPTLSMPIGNTMLYSPMFHPIERG